MQNDVKSAIRFNEFAAYFGPRGVLVMAWWMGAVHAARIRQDLNRFPFLQIVGAAGSGKSLLLDYLQKLTPQKSTAHSLSHATQAGRMRIFADQTPKIIICESYGESEGTFDWDELKPLYDASGFGVRSAAHQVQTVTFKGAITITANQPLECRAALRSRMVFVNLSGKDAHATRVRPEAFIDISADEANAFGTLVQQSEELIANTLHTQVPAFTGKLTRKYGEKLGMRNALNYALMLALLDLLCTLLSISDALRNEATDLVHEIASADMQS